MTYTRDWTQDSQGLRKYTSVIRCPVIIKMLFCSENGTPASFFHSSPAIRLRFLVAILENKKNLSGNYRGTNVESLESLNNIYPRSLHSVVWKEKKLAHKNSPLLKSTRFPKKLAQSQRGRGWYSTSFIRGSRLSSNPLPFNEPFFTEKVPFSFALYWQMVSLYLIKFLRTFHPF